jgi:predicted nuclease of restriction endonuclease-like (RecB) superfamily
MNIIKNDNKDFIEFIKMYEEAKKNAYYEISNIVNKTTVDLYWNYGKRINELSKDAKYGAKIVPKLATWFKDNYPELKIFDKRNLFYMLKFYTIYKDNEKVNALRSQLTWTNNRIIIVSCKTMDERIFYMQFCLQNRLSSRELERFIKSSYYERYKLANNNLNDMLPIKKDNIIEPKILDTYALEFLGLKEKHSEKELKQSILNNLKMFFLELGGNLSLIGNEVKIKLDNKTYYIDLLMYHTSLNCYIVIELKIGEYKAEYASKMQLYLSIIDKEYKNVNPSIGLILCKGKNNNVIKYSFNKKLNKIEISNYLTKLPDKKILENIVRK